MSNQEQHRKQVVTSAIEFLAKKRDAVVESIKFPDEEERKAQEVDAKFVLSGSTIVLEHTRTESFARQIGSGKLWAEFFEQLENDISGKLPCDGSFRLGVADTALMNVKRKHYDAVRKSLKEWIYENAPKLPTVNGCLIKIVEMMIETPNGVPFEVKLWKWPATSGHPGLFMIHRELTKDLQKERASRVYMALEKKLPKLNEAKTRHGASGSALIIESDDLSLGNHWEITEALRTEATKFPNLLPDEVYLIETDHQIPDRWVLWELRDSSKWTPDDNLVPYYLTV